MTKRRNSRHLRLNVYRGSGGEPPKVPPGELLLEYFSDHEVLAWRAKSKDVQLYHYLWYFELEAQRAAHQQQIVDALRSQPGRAIDLSGWGRAMPYKYSSSPLSCVGSLKWVGGRFNYGSDIDSTRFAPFPALYLAEDMETGLREMQGLTRENSRAGLTASELNLCSKNGLAWVPVTGRVSNIFDLTRSSFMLENWREYPSVLNTPANSQLFGHLLSIAGYEGALFSSTRTKKQNIVLFTRQFKDSASLVRVLNPPISARCCELSPLTYKGLELEI